VKGAEIPGKWVDLVNGVGEGVGRRGGATADPARGGAGRAQAVAQRAGGYGRLPAEGPAILCPNHILFLYSAFLMLTMPRNISFVGKAEYMDSWKTRYLFPALGMVPDRPLRR
jgi:hypothetical protein